jgi:hypothetical protein
MEVLVEARSLRRFSSIALCSLLRAIAAFREVLIHELPPLRFRGSERLCFLPEVRHEAAEFVSRLRLYVRLRVLCWR